MFDSSPFGHFYSTLRIDIDASDGVAIKHSLDLTNRFLLIIASGGGANSLFIGLSERGPDEYEGFKEAFGRCDEGLIFNLSDCW